MSGARVFVPISVADADLIASNVPENDAPAWLVGTTYAQGDEVIHNHRVWKSTQAGNTGHTPAASSTWWSDQGATNRWRAFDQVLGQSVSNTGSITYTVRLTGKVSGIALFGLSAASLRVLARDISSGDVMSDSGVVDLVDTSEIIDAWTYFTWQPVYQTRWVTFGVSGFVGQDLEITVDAGAGTAEVAQVAFGRSHNLGTPTTATLSIEDYSLKERDDFGNARIVERAFSQEADVTVLVPKADTDRVQPLLEGLRATPAVWVPSETHLATMIYGWLADWSLPLDSDRHYLANLQLEALT